MNQFKRVGPAIAFGESLVDIDQAQAIHDTAATELFLAARHPYLELSDDQYAMRYSFYFKGLDSHEDSLPDRYVSVQLAHDIALDWWRLIINDRTYRPAERHTNKRICYRFETFGDQLLEATKAVYFVLGSSHYYFDTATDEAIENIETERKMYEKPLGPDDCERILIQLGRTAQRAAVSRRQ